MKQGFTFKQSWREAIKSFDADVRLEVYESAIDYALYNIERELSPIAKLAFAFIKQDIDDERMSYQKIVDRNRANGQKGGRPKTQENPEEPKKTQKTQVNPNNPVGLKSKKDDSEMPKKQVKKPSTGISGADKTQTNPNNPVGFGAPAPSISDTSKERTKENISDDIYIDKYNNNSNSYNNNSNSNSSNRGKSDSPKPKNDGLFPLLIPPEDDEFVRFNRWLDINCPFVRKVKTQMTLEQFRSLKKKYTHREIASALEALNNWADFPKKRTNVYRSTLDELKKMYGERSC